MVDRSKVHNGWQVFKNVIRILLQCHYGTNFDRNDLFMPF